MAVFVQHHDFLFRDQKVPSASDAVVEPSLLAKQRGIAHRPDYKLVPKAGFALLCAKNVAFPKLHEKALNAFSGPNGKAKESKAKLKSDYRASFASCFITKCGMRFEILRAATI
jgi:hypothetical protein